MIFKYETTAHMYYLGMNIALWIELVNHSYLRQEVK